MGMQTDTCYITRCLQLAANGLGHTAPNPLVGCVIVKDGRIISEGYHQQYGQNHAERNALLADRGCQGKPDYFKGATLYVNLEPCSHFGKTPPCADLIIEKGIGKVVCCNDDPNPRVAGAGFARLEQAGIEVVRHVMEDEGRWLNRRFFTFMEQHRPYVILKWAETADGFIDIPRQQQKPVENDNPACCGHQYWISTPVQTLLSHRWRTQEAAILIGSTTYINDHPQLTARLICGPNPQPVVLDRRGRLVGVSEHWLHLQSPTVEAALQTLYNQGLQSVIVEGGRQVLDAFIASELYDEVRIFRSPALFGAGLKAPSSAGLRNVCFY